MSLESELFRPIPLYMLRVPTAAAIRSYSFPLNTTLPAPLTHTHFWAQRSALANWADSSVEEQSFKLW